MSLQIHRSASADRLAAALGDLLSTPLADPFVGEVVSVPTPGVERWLSQTLSHRLGTSPGGRDGVCAGVSFPSPRRLTAQAIATVTGVDPRSDPWQPHRAVWPLLGVVDAARGQDWAALLWAYLGDRPGAGPDPVRHGRRWATAQHLADLYGAYAAGRPAMLQAWLRGDDVDGHGSALGPDRAWQAELWRRLRAEIGAPGPAERLPAACARLAADRDATDLPDRISVFGATRLSAEHQAVLTALAEHRDVHLWLTHASPGLWDSVASTLDASPPASRRRSDDPTADVAQHRLLGYLGRDARELQVTLHATGAVDHHHPTELQAGPATLLDRLQHDLATDQPLRLPADRERLAPGDRSVQLHACHGPDRQVEVLRELLVGMLDADPTLEPRDIVVMCPDIETFAPLISASFGLADGETTATHPGHRLRVRLADRSLRQLNPLLSVLSSVLQLVDSRMEATSLLDLFTSAPVARKFGFSEDDLLTVHDLVGRSGVRWGLDADHRDAFGMKTFGQNTWSAGLDRLLLGVTMDEQGQQFIGTALPLDDVDSSDVELVGRIAECVNRVRRATDDLIEPRPLDQWVEACKHVLETLTATTVSDGWQTAHAYAELGRLAEAVSDRSHASDDSALLSTTELRALLGEVFRGRPSRANFRTGTLTMCTMMPMRSIPHRVVCLLGVDDGVFPRVGATDGDDILAADPWVGDRDPRSEDRQLLLDAVMAAEETLAVVYSGADPRTGAAVPPAVPIGELMDVLDLTALASDGREVRTQILTEHPLQPFDALNFTPGALGALGDHGVSFDTSALRGAQAAAGPRTSPRASATTPSLPPVEDTGTVGLDELVRFFNHPLKALMRTRAGLYVLSDDEPVSDEIPVGLDALEAWAVGDRLLRRHLEGLELDRLVAAEWRRGQLPPRAFGSRTLDPILSKVGKLASAARPYLEEEPTSHDVWAQLGDVLVSGTCSSVVGDRLVTVNYSRLGPKHRLKAWIELLALTVTEPERGWTAATVGGGGRSMLGPVDPTFARTVLGDLVELYRTGMTGPIPYGPKTSAEYARLRYSGKEIRPFMEKLEREWANERDNAAALFFGPDVPLAALLATESEPAEERGSLAEPSRFGTLARRVWHPLLMSEVQS